LKWRAAFCPIFFQAFFEVFNRFFSTVLENNVVLTVLLNHQILPLLLAQWPITKGRQCPTITGLSQVVRKLHLPWLLGRRLVAKASTALATSVTENDSYLRCGWTIQQ
jgi:hypothetical protein